MPDSLYVPIDQDLPIRDLLDYAAREMQEILRVKQDLKICAEIPRGSPSSSVPPIIPDHPPWDMYLYAEDIDESLVEAHVSILTAEEGKSPVVVYFRELRTTASQALAAALAVAAAQLLQTEILDLEHKWVNRAQIRPSDFLEQVKVSRIHANVAASLDEFRKKMNRP